MRYPRALALKPWGAISKMATPRRRSNRRMFVGGCLFWLVFSLAIAMGYLALYTVIAYAAALAAVWTATITVGWALYTGGAWVARKVRRS